MLFNENMPHNGVECLDCPGFGNYFVGERECPRNGRHATLPALITSFALGSPLDNDSQVVKMGIWVYDIEALYFHDWPREENHPYVMLGVALAKGRITQAQHDDLMLSLFD